MSSTTQTPSVVTLYPSAKEDVKAYMAAIRLASSVRNSMDAQKASVDQKPDGEKTVMNADSYGRHHPKIPPPSLANSTTPSGRGPVPPLNQTSFGQHVTNATKPGSVSPRDSYPSPDHAVRTGIWTVVKSIGSKAAAIFSTSVDAPTNATPETLKQRQGNSLPPKNHGPMIVTNSTAHVNPPSNFTKVSPGESISNPTAAIPIGLNQGPPPYNSSVPGGIAPQCQYYVTNTDINITFTVCPAEKRDNITTRNLARRQLYSGNSSSLQTLAVRNTAMCEAPIGFNEHVACGKYDGWFVGAFFILIFIAALCWMKICKRTSHEVDEEHGRAIWPRPSRKASIKIAEAKLREKVCNAHKEARPLDEELSTEQYEPVAWRSTSRRAEQANPGGNVVHDAGPVAELPMLITEVVAYHGGS